MLAQRGGGGDPVAAGGRLYRATCANCHGLDGASIVGVDLGHNKFKRASTDDDLVGIIINGIPGTGMPPNTIPRPQALTIVAYLRSLGAPSIAAGGDVSRGHALFAGKGCAGCHRVLGTGSRTGPDLSEIGSFRKAAELQQSILEPDADIQPDNRTFKAVTRDGKNITGRVINEDGFTLQVLDSHEHLLSLEKSGLKEYSYSDKSGMPSYKGRLSDQELADLVTYLSSLKRMDSK
ncbi:MAG TPA: c-type cytochrome [Bryobacteraceae bacterium]|nr:c-type cytochrome [Bryobacteraceae bacterium]